MFMCCTVRHLVRRGVIIRNAASQTVCQNGLEGGQPPFERAGSARAVWRGSLAAVAGEDMMVNDKFLGSAAQRRSQRRCLAARSPLSVAARVSVMVSMLALAGCAVEVVEIQNVQALREYAQQTAPPGSVYAGWRVFQDKCAGCHGAAATGAAGGPDLLPRVREMGPRQFTSLVLQRYDWSPAVVRSGSDGAAQEALVDQVLQRRQGALEMPAWQGEPSVDVHIMDLYAYVSARAQGTQGPGRPAP
jgi:mono/diheme cytochrome c family protein